VSQFGFLQAEFETQFVDAQKSEDNALRDPRAACFYARRFVESSMKWMFRYDTSLVEPYEATLNAFVTEPSFQRVAGERGFNLVRKIQHAGNRAVHENKAPAKTESVEVVSALWEFAFWFAYTYGRGSKPDPDLRFNPHLLLQPEGQVVSSKIKDLEAAVAEVDARAAELATTNEQLEQELAEARRQVAAAKQAAEEVPPSSHEWSEAETREYLIDVLLQEVGWDLEPSNVREFEVTGMPNNKGIGYVDYVLWGDDGKPLAVVEAKKAAINPQEGQQQAKLYADCLEEMFDQRPLIFYSNGYEHWLWDDTNYPPRQVQGFYTKDELQLAIQRRTSQLPLADVDINTSTVERHYQHRAIRNITESFDVQKQRKALLAMATGTGKTRTVIALIDVLMRANRVKNVLFLADRTELVKQAVGAFKEHLPNSQPINLVSEPDETGRVYVSTYQTMVGMIDRVDDQGVRRFGPGHFDLVVIDEAHRSVYGRYKGIFNYFDSLLVGLTATPRDEIDHNTYDLFDLETGVPTDAYSLEEAVADGFLTPPRGISVPLKFIREGINYDDLSADEQESWDQLDWGQDEDGLPIPPPEQVDPPDLNKWLFNEDTVDKVLENLMTDGIKVAGGDRLGKTIIFAKNQRHADFIYERFIANYPHLDNGDFARVISYQVNYAGSLIEDFKKKEATPHIAISVDMLDTGVDVPEIVNLVFFKLVRSKTKFWQMVGRGTRLCPDLFAPGSDKTSFNVFDYCQNLEYFTTEIPPAESPGGKPLSELIFRARLDVLHQLNVNKLRPDYQRLAQVLHQQVSSMNTDNFLVRPHRRIVDQYKLPQAWNKVGIGDLAQLAETIAGLPDQLAADTEEAKRWDLLILNTQLMALENAPFDQLQQRIIKIASRLEDQRSIPAIEQHIELILDVQTERWWTDVTHGELEALREKLRGLIHLLEKTQKDVVYTDFVDELGRGTIIDVVGEPEDTYKQFRKKASAYLKEHLGEPAIAKVRSGLPLTASDFEELQRILVAAGSDSLDDFESAVQQAGNIAAFVRSLVGLDREAAKERFSDFLDESRHTANQIQFVNQLIDYLAENGTIEPGRVYEDPFTAVAPQGPEQIFTAAEIEDIFTRLRDLEATTAVS
jgi:type I restriction enzyme R subunit